MNHAYYSFVHMRVFHVMTFLISSPHWVFNTHCMLIICAQSVKGVEQKSRTRFFNMDHIYAFRTLLPSLAHEKHLSRAEALERTPIRWRVAMIRSEYENVFPRDQKQQQRSQDMGDETIFKQPQ